MHYVALLLISLWGHNTMVTADHIASPSVQSSGWDGKPIAGNQDVALSPERRSELEGEALRGNPDAAMKLAQSYLIPDARSGEGRYWMQLAVENGSLPAMYGLGSALRYSDDRRDRVRAVYWLHRAIKECPPPYPEYSRAVLSEMGEK